MGKITEVEICKIVSEHFSHADIYPEVPCSGGIIDLVIVDKPLTIVVEAKTSLSFQLIEQAVSRLGMGNVVYVAVPIRPTNSQIKYLQHFGIGIFTVGEMAYRYGAKEYVRPVFEVLKPKLFRKIKPPELHEYMKQSEAGSQSNRITAFGHFVSELKKQLEKHKDGATYQKLFDEQTFAYYRTFKYFKNNIYQYVNRGIITGIEIEKGILKLSNT